MQVPPQAPGGRLQEAAGACVSGMNVSLPLALLPQPSLPLSGGGLDVTCVYGLIYGEEPISLQRSDLEAEDRPSEEQSPAQGGLQREFLAGDSVPGRESTPRSRGGPDRTPWPGATAFTVTVHMDHVATPALCKPQGHREKNANKAHGNTRSSNTRRVSETAQRGAWVRTSRHPGTRMGRTGHRLKGKTWRNGSFWSMTYPCVPAC